MTFERVKRRGLHFTAAGLHAIDVHIILQPNPETDWRGVWRQPISDDAYAPLEYSNSAPEINSNGVIGHRSIGDEQARAFVTYIDDRVKKANEIFEQQVIPKRAADARLQSDAMQRLQARQAELSALAENFPPPD